MNRSGSPAVLAVHPWEFDLDPPKVRLPASLHFAHYFRLDGFRNRLRSILGSATFGPISTARSPAHGVAMNVIWFPLAAFLFGSQQPGQAVSGAVPRIAIEDSVQVDAARLREVPMTSLCPSPCACRRLPLLMRALSSTRS